MTTAGVDWSAEIEAERAQLFALAYRMLGSASEADDVLQEAWLRVREGGEAPRSPRAWLTTVVARLCLDHLKSARRRREAYVGPWLPEPIAGEAALDRPEGAVTPDDRVGAGESVSMAFLVLLETLSPLERAAFLLREVFEYDFQEIGAALGRSEAACRQLYHRARAHVAARRPRYRPASAEAAQLAAAFMQAATTGDVPALTALLADDAVMTSDGGGRVTAARRPVAGAGTIAQVFANIVRKAPAGARATPATINGETGFFLWVGEALFGTLVFSTEGGRVAALRFVVNPDKLQRLAASIAPGPAGVRAG